MKAKIILAILFVFALVSFVYAVPAYSHRCDITANITSLKQTSVTLKIYYVMNDSYCKGTYPLGSERSYDDPMYLINYSTENSTKVSVGQMINTTIDRWGDEHSNGFVLSQIKFLDVAGVGSNKNQSESLLQKILNWVKKLFG